MPIRTLDDIREVESRPYADFMPHTSIAQALGAAASRHAQRTALTFVESALDAGVSPSWTYAAFAQDVNRTARLFQRLTSGEVPRVAMLLPAIPEAYFALWGAEVAGVACPINYLMQADAIAELILASGANILIALGPHPDLDIWAKVEPVRRRCPGLRAVVAVGGSGPDGAMDFAAEVATCAPDPIDPRRYRGADDIAALFHTGGTTGAPKLAQHTNRNQLHASRGAALMYAMSEEDVMLNGFPLFHVAGSFVFGLSTLLTGGEVVLPTMLGMRNAAFVARYWSLVERHQVTLLAAVPTVIATLLSIADLASDRRSVRALLTGGSPLPSELAAQFEERYRIPVRNILGMTECAGVISIEPFDAPRTPGSCGLPLPFTAVEVVPDPGMLACEGTSPTGVLRVRGPHVGPGYTDASRNPGTFDADGWLTTGDLGHVDLEGRVFVTGRSKDVIIRSSHNIDPGVIEAVFLRHPDVELAAAVGQPDEYAGEVPVVYVSGRPGVSLDAATLRAFVEPLIPERPAMPKRIEILSALPTTAIGKVFKPALRERATLHVLQDRLQTAGLLDAFTVEMEATPSGFAVRFTNLLGASPSVSADQRLQAVMAPFALAYRIVPLT